MSRGPFRERLEASISRVGAPLCVGLDPDPAQLPEGLSRDLSGVRHFCLSLIEATAPCAAAYKPNLAFFERFGGPGLELLRELVAEAGTRAPVIADAKRGDIGSTARAYAEALYDELGADACTVSPYLGGDSVRPFIERADRFAYVLCHTSNEGASEFQEQGLGEGGRPLYLEVALRARSWDQLGTVGLVVGATWPEQLARVRALTPELPLLLPGVGAQGALLEETVRAASGPEGSAPYLVTISRGIAQAGSGADFAAAAAAAAERFRGELATALGNLPSPG